MLIRKHWEDRKGKCYHCDKVGWEEFHVIWECEGLNEVRRRTGLLDRMELSKEGEFTMQDVREKLRAEYMLSSWSLDVAESITVIVVIYHDICIMCMTRCTIPMHTACTSNRETG